MKLEIKIAAVGLAFAGLAILCACAPANEDGTTVLNEVTSRDYYRDPRTNQCWSQWGSYMETAVYVPCTPEVLALVGYPPAPAVETVR